MSFIYFLKREKYNIVFVMKPVVFKLFVFLSFLKLMLDNISFISFKQFVFEAKFCF